MVNVSAAPSSSADESSLQSPQWRPAVWAIGASMLLHVLGFAAFHNSLLLDQNVHLDAVTTTGDGQLLTATLLPPPQLLPAIKVDSPSSKAVMAKPNAPPSVSPNKTPVPASAPVVDSPNLPEPPPVVALNNAAETVATPAPPLPEPLPVVAVAVTPTMPAAPTTSITPPPVEAQTRPQTALITQLPTTIAPSSYSLPNQATIRYEASVMGISGKSVLTWKKTTQDNQLRYETQLESSATVFFKAIEHRYKSAGVINSIGLAPLAVEEKRTNGSVVATTVEPQNNRTIISSKEGFLPYDPLGKDIVSLIVQLGINVQSQPQWFTAGTAQDFTVYRPSGIKRWRFQSMGVETLNINNQILQTVYIKRVPLGAEADFEDEHHFWLDPRRYGFPVKMRFVQNRGLSTDIVMADWQEQ